MKRTLQLSYENTNEKAKKPFATPFWRKISSNLQIKAIRLLTILAMSVWNETCRIDSKRIKQNMSHVCGLYTTLSDVIQIAAKKRGLEVIPHCLSTTTSYEQKRPVLY